VTLTIRASPASLPSGAFGGLRPPAIGVLTLRAAGEVSVEIRVDGDGDGADAFAARKLIADDLETSVLLHPLRSCALNRWCTTVVTISATTANPARADDSSVAVEWRLDLTLPYPGLDAVPAGADLEILVDADDA
jgi:hypothetical protein